MLYLIDKSPSTGHMQFNGLKWDIISTRSMDSKHLIYAVIYQMKKVESLELDLMRILEVVEGASVVAEGIIKKANNSYEIIQNLYCEMHRRRMWAITIIDQWLNNQVPYENIKTRLLKEASP